MRLTLASRKQTRMGHAGQQREGPFRGGETQPPPCAPRHTSARPVPAQPAPAGPHWPQRPSLTAFPPLGPPPAAVRPSLLPPGTASAGAPAAPACSCCLLIPLPPARLRQVSARALLPLRPPCRCSASPAWPAVRGAGSSRGAAASPAATSPSPRRVSARGVLSPSPQLRRLPGPPAAEAGEGGGRLKPREKGEVCERRRGARAAAAGR